MLATGGASARRGGTNVGRVLALTAIACAVALTLVACVRPVPIAGDDSRDAAGGDTVRRPLRVVATVGMVADAVRNVGGERVQVTTLMGPGVDPHLYVPSEGDVRRLSEADLIFHNGLHLEARLGDVLKNMPSRVGSYAVAEAIDPSLLLAPEEFAGAYDPHVWFDVSLWMVAVERVRDALIERDPAGADQYRAHAGAYLEQLSELHRYVKAQADTVPARHRVLVTAHDAFNYFGRAYGFDVRGLQGISTATEAGAADVQELADFIAERQLAAIFVESSVPPRTIEAVQEAVRARGWDVKIGGELYSDALGEEGTPAGTYVGMVRHNIDTIATALRGG
ncbi:MAG: zinc ABC transporter substrate-binding protein [Chloroflexota bacterium]|nr:zinc ABC transporter substrate-binding protein [Chloroflexota bacterium]